MRRLLNVCLFLMGFMVLSVGPKAFAAFVQSPTVAPHNFPGTYTATTSGLALQPCLDTGGACGPAVEIPATFPNPVNYWVAQARLPTYGGKGGNPSPFRPGGQATATLTMVLAGTFIPDVNGDPIIAEGNQFVMQSLEVVIDSLLDGAAYTVTTPFGVFDNLIATYDSRRNADSIKEISEFPAVPAAGNFDQSAFPTSPYSATPGTFASFPGMDRFLVCAGGPQATGFLGPQDLTGALLECTIAGSPLGAAFDVFRIEGPEVGGGPNVYDQLLPDGFTCDDTTGQCLTRPTTSVDMIETTQFRIIGRASGPPLADTDGDGFADPFDNCPNVQNTALFPDAEGWAPQEDEDGDGIGNACDLVIPPQFIPQARMGSDYSHELTILRSQVSHTCALAGGFLPAALTLDSDCFIRGNVTAAGFTATFTAQVTDSTGDTATRVLKIKSKMPGCYSCHVSSTF